MSEPPPPPSAQELNLLQGPPEVQLPDPQVQPPLNSTPEPYSYKNKLQEYAQKLSLRFPAYDTINEGSQHAPQFRSVVLVDGNYYKSTSVFPQRKLAEQDAARVALDDLSQKIKEDGRPLVSEDATFCKCILHEYTDKMHIEKPTYHTVRREGLLPSFVSVVNFNGISYNGVAGKSKKEAEQLAARAAILSVIDSDPSGIICKIIKSKVKLYSALNKMKDDSSGVIPALSSRSSCGNERKEVEAAGIEINLPLSASDKITEMQAVIESFHTFKKPRPEISNVEIAPPIAFVPAGSQQLQLPSTSLQLRSASLQLPSKSPQLPSASLQLPSTSLQLPSTSPQLPSAFLQLPSTSLQLPSTSTSPQLPSASLQLPSTSLQLPSTSLQLPSASLQLPSTSLQLPLTSLQLPSTSLQRPSTSLQLPSTSLQLPSTSLQLPLASLQPPSTLSQLPSASLPLPTTSLQFPSESFEIPSALGVKRSRKSKKKKKKRSVADAQLPAAVLPLRQVPPCSVAQ